MGYHVHGRDGHQYTSTPVLNWCHHCRKGLRQGVCSKILCKPKLTYTNSMMANRLVMIATRFEKVIGGQSPHSWVTPSAQVQHQYQTTLTATLSGTLRQGVCSKILCKPKLTYTNSMMANRLVMIATRFEKVIGGQSPHSWVTPSAPVQCGTGWSNWLALGQVSLTNHCNKERLFL
jgi:hypothetical protein